MHLLKYLNPKKSTKRKILDIRDDIKKLLKHNYREKFNVIYYGAYDIDPRHLVFWICVESDKLKELLTKDHWLNDQLRMLLEKHDYPGEAQPFVHIGFESQETVDRESGGNWYHHFK